MKMLYLNSQKQYTLKWVLEFGFEEFIIGLRIIKIPLSFTFSRDRKKN